MTCCSYSLVDNYHLKWKVNNATPLRKNTNKLLISDFSNQKINPAQCRWNPLPISRGKTKFYEVMPKFTKYFVSYIIFFEQN